MTEAELEQLLASPIIKRSVMIAGHASSVTIEEPFWEVFKEIAKAQGKSINTLVTELDDVRPQDGSGANLSSAIRLYVLHSLQSG